MNNWAEKPAHRKSAQRWGKFKTEMPELMEFRFGLYIVFKIVVHLFFLNPNIRRPILVHNWKLNLGFQTVCRTRY